MSWTGARSPARTVSADRQSANLADILERVLDKGIVIVGDIRVNLLDIELLTIKLRLLVASVDRAKEMGIDWWEHDPSLSSRARPAAEGSRTAVGGAGRDELEAENRRLRDRLAALEAASASADASQRTEIRDVPEDAQDGARKDTSEHARKERP
ncbi:gas vesicle protein [Actinomadura rupiterrae]|uniref:gas vesicle protein n=1 Tax=Actinomadura rupiterrae TaxID=559627 RepID=UPI0020A5169B|nr:gas vesicle protein [Actinomadura rupiterrae]